MADLALAAAQTLFAALECTVLKDVCSMWGYKSELQDLMKTVSTTEKVLLDADAQRDLSHQAQHYIQDLKDAVYDADDLFDEVRTRAELKQLDKGDELSERVRDFFSSKKNPLSTAYRMSKEVKKIKKTLDAIAKDHANFGFKLDFIPTREFSRPIRERREETCAYVYAPNIVGREDDKKDVIGRMLESNVGQGIGFLTIVGVGGLGKTALAQLVSDDERVKIEFPLRLWVCVADQDGQKFHVQTILLKILKSVDGVTTSDSSSMEELKNQFQKHLGGKKCFLVLDDIWTEHRCEWDNLKGFLMAFGEGSRILVTSRSKETARVIGHGNKLTYELKGLSDDDSWRLFQLSALETGHELDSYDLVDIGKMIVKQCHNVPLVIKVVGSLLFGQGITQWHAFQKTGFEKITQGDEKIMSILKLSYDNLECSLKSCFVYCALFPKDFEIKKNMLISLWLAQGYIKPLYEGQNIEAAAEDHFSILLRRYFFQDVRMNEFGDVESCKIHDMMHDVALKVAGKDICSASAMGNNSSDAKVCHVFEDRNNFDLRIWHKTKLRSYIHIGSYQIDSYVSMTLGSYEKWESIRSMSLEAVEIEILPNSIERLLHLRYLNLYRCRKLKRLPNGITKLLNLQTLILRDCRGLKELPEKLSKLINPRQFDMRGTGMSYMPGGMDKLSCLSVLTVFYKVAFIL